MSEVSRGRGSRVEFTDSVGLCIILQIMSGGNVRRLQDARRKRAAREAHRQPRRTPTKASQLQRSERRSRIFKGRERRRSILAAINQVYRQRRLMVGVLALFGVLAFFLAVLVQSPGAADQPLPIDPNEAGPDVVVAEADGLGISTPIRPADLAGLGYHPGGEGVLDLQPEGKNLSANPLLSMFGGTDPKDIRYYVMDREHREGPGKGALDVGAEAGAKVYAPVTGVVTAVRPDPTMQNANVVEIKPAEDPNTRVFVSLLQDVSGGIGPDAPVTAGMTELGSVADLASVTKPQLAEYINASGNHVTVAVLKAG